MYPGGCKHITDNALVTEGPGLLNGFAWTCTGAGGTIVIYDGLDAGSGRKLFDLPGNTNTPNALEFARPVWFGVGLYVTLDANVSGITLRFDPLRSDQLG